MRVRSSLCLLGLAVGLLTAASGRAAVDCSDGAAVGNAALRPDHDGAQPGTFENPWVNRHHVFCGEINRRGRPVGFHYREDGEDPRLGPGNNNPAAARITGRIKSQDGASGWRIYRGDDIEIWDDSLERYLLKSGFSTFFPDGCSPSQVLASIRYAVLHSRRPLPANGGRFRGISGPAQIDERYCYRRDAAGRREQPFPVTGFLNNRRGYGGWVINTAYPE